MCAVAVLVACFFFFFKQKTAYELRISDWSSDVCSSDLRYLQGIGAGADADGVAGTDGFGKHRLELADHLAKREIARADQLAQFCENRLGVCILQIGRAACRERVCQ